MIISRSKGMKIDNGDYSKIDSKLFVYHPVVFEDDTINKFWSIKNNSLIFKGNNFKDVLQSLHVFVDIFLSGSFIKGCIDLYYDDSSFDVIHVDKNYLIVYRCIDGIDYSVTNVIVNGKEIEYLDDDNDIELFFNKHMKRFHPITDPITDCLTAHEKIFLLKKAYFL